MKKIFTVIAFLLFCGSVFGQLANFNLSVSKTDETCTGNGTLTFSTTNTTAGASIIYSVYLLPDTTTPIMILANNSLTGLSAGVYRVVALQTLDSESNTQQQDIEILDARNPLVYQLSSNPITCYSLSGTITVNVSQGEPLTYEIISGPIIVAPQTSNVFNNLVLGTYDIRVNDSCGDGIVQTHTITQLYDSNLTVAIIPPVDEVGECNLSNCEFRTVQAEVTCLPGTTIHYPIQVEVTVFPPNGATPIVILETITSGSPTLQALSLNIPYFNVPSYSYEIKVIGTCGEESVAQSVQLSNPSDYVLSTSGNSFNPCYRSLLLYRFCNLLPPLNVNFISAPAGFNPADFNANNLGPFDSLTIEYDSFTQLLPLGEYVVEVTDSCGNAVQHTIELFEPETFYEVIPITCSSDMDLTIYDIVSLFILDAPESLGLTLPMDATSLINAANDFLMTLVPGTYIFTGVGVCGNQFNITIIIEDFEFEIEVETENFAGCSGNYGKIRLKGNRDLESVILLQAPPAFVGTLPYDFSSSILFTQIELNNLPAGEYVFEVTDVCGEVLIVTAIIPVIISQAPLLMTQREGCGANFDSIACISPNGAITEFIIISAPAAFPFPLPYDASFNIASNGYLCMNSLPVGEYIFYSKDECNVERNETIVLQGFQATEDIQLTPNCGSFDLDVQYPNNNQENENLWLQKFNSLTNQWVHPLTGVPYVENAIPNVTNSYPLNNLTMNYNIASVGLFRIIADTKIFQNGQYSLQSCISIIKTFEFTGALDIESTYSITCNSGSLEVIVVANGVPPYTYKITTKNGQPFLVDNGNSNLFTGLESAIYNFQIIDSCGNILNKLIDLTTIEEPAIEPSNLCNGQIGQLSVPAISYLSYQWWKGTDTTTILSTSNTLEFNPFSSATTPGTYFVRIYSTTPVSCIDMTISFVVNAVESPNAGDNGELTLCGTSNAIDLFTLIGNSFDNNGTWQEITNSGNLVGNIWSTNGVGFGSYVFNYTVNGLCSTSDQSTVTINFNAPPATPEINGDQEYCVGETITLQVEPLGNATFQWSGPNNFSSNSQSVVIENASEQNAGDYSVRATLNGCESTSSIPVAINPNPNFSFEELCFGSNYTIKVVPIQNSFDPNNVTYSWTGPNNFSSSQSQIVVTNQNVGNYSLTVTNQNNCSQLQSVEVESALCEFANIITPNNDGSNDSFDLTGFDVDKFEIYSRWGRLVYEENNYIDSWHGQNMNNEPLPDSTYYYIISLHSGEQKHGWIFLAR